MAYWRLIAAHFKQAFLNEMQYRMNFFIHLLQAGAELAFGLLGIALVFSHTETLKGWTQAELLVVVGIHTLLGGVINMGIRPNMMRLIRDVREGTLDFTIVRPVDAQVLMSIRETNVWSITDVMLGVAVLIIAGAQSAVQIGIGHFALFVLTLLAGIAMMYSVWLILATTTFWFVQVVNVYDIFSALFQAGRWPVGVYPAWMRAGLSFIVPVAFAVTVPAEALTERLSVESLAAALIVAIILLIVSRRFWLLGLRHYSGASA